MLDYFIFNSFADTAFEGNPGAFILDSRGRLTDTQMQKIAREFGLSETAFVGRNSDGDFTIRWFTPTTEVELCGHATLGSAFCLHKIGKVDHRPFRFISKGGPLEIELLQGPEAGQIQMNFPLVETHPKPVSDALQNLLPQLKILSFAESEIDSIFEVQDTEALSSINPDLPALKKLGDFGVAFTTNSGDLPEGVDFVSRVFAPLHGIPEDPVTGSTHCALAHFWQQKTGKSSLVGLQASHRPGKIAMEILPEQRVLLKGEAQIVAKGQILIPK